MDLGALCNALLKTADNPNEYDEIVQQFIHSTTLDPSTLESIASDPNLSTLVQCLFNPLIRYQVIKTSKSQITPKLNLLMNFISDLAMSHPDILRTIAANAPVDDLVSKYMRGLIDKKGTVQNPLRIQTFIKFFAIICSEPGIIIQMTETLSVVLDVCESLFNSDKCAEWALATIGCLLHNSPAGIPFVKSQPKYGKFKTLLASLLSSQSAAVVLASLSVFIQLYPTQTSTAVVAKTAINALGAADEFCLAPRLSSMIILELADTIKLSPDDVWAIIENALGGGMKSFVLYSLLRDLPSCHPTVIEVFSSMNCLFHVINSMLDSPNVYVSIAGCGFLFAVFNDSVQIVFSDEVIEPFTKALKIATGPSKFIETPRKEAALLLLRFMIRARESTVVVIPVLEEMSSQIFLDFQRNIESNQSYISTQYFLFLFEISHFVSAWRQRIGNIVLDTQLPALIVNVMNESRNRDAIADAITAMQIITGGFSSDQLVERTPLFSSVVDGHLFCNKQKFETEKSDVNKLEQMTQELFTQASELEVERDLCVKELSAAKKNAQQSSDDLTTKIELHLNVEEKNASLKASVESLQKRVDNLSTGLKQAEAANANLKQQLSELQKLSSATSVRSAGIRTKENTINSMTAEIKEAEEEIKRMEEAHAQAEIDIKKYKQSRVALKESIKKASSATARRKIAVDMIMEKLEELQSQREKLMSSIKTNEKQTRKLREAMRELEQSEQSTEQKALKYREEIEKIRRDIDTIVLRTTLKLQTMDQMQEHLLELEAENNEYKMLMKVVHKSTYPNMRIPENVSSMMQLV